MDKYEFKNHQLTIKDESLDLKHEEKFDPVRIPEDLKNNLKLRDDHTLKIFRLSDGSFEYWVEKQNQLNGEYNLTHPSGKIKQQCYYNWGKLHGPSTFYSEEGNVLVKSWYIQGKQTGKCHWFYVSGKKCSTQNYLDSVWHGKQEYWYEDGTVKTIMEYQKGTVHGRVALFYPTGDLKRELFFENGSCVKESKIDSSTGNK
ncbi:MAG: hypothetical protein VX777_07890 [Chlamydiota bacterium]|nr:hypothetical protein [Chlamydiota bacterium]